MKLIKLDIDLSVWAILLFSLYVFLNPFVYDINQEYQFQYYWLNYIAIVLLVFSFLMFLFKGRLVVNKVFYFILLFQMYSIFVSFYVNLDELQYYNVKYAITLAFCCLISAVSYLLGVSTRHYSRSAFKLNHVITLLVFIIVGLSLMVSEDLFYFRRPYASTMILCFLLLIVLFFAEIKSGYKLFFVIPFITLTVISGSRIQLFLMIIIFCTFIYHTYSLRVLTYILSSLVILFSILLLIENSVTVIEFGGLQRLQNTSLSGRSDAWGSAISFFMENNYILGNGIFPNEYLLSHGEILTTAHNFYLQVLTTLGVFGMLIFLLMFYALFSSANITGKLFLISIMITGIAYDTYFVVSYISRIPEYVVFYYILGLFSVKGDNVNYESVNVVRK